MLLPLSFNQFADASTLCINYADYVHVVGGVDTPQYAQALALRGNLIYVADNSSGLHVVDVSAPNSPTLVGSMSTPAVARPSTSEAMTTPMLHTRRARTACTSSMSRTPSLP